MPLSIAARAAAMAACFAGAAVGIGAKSSAVSLVTLTATVLVLMRHRLFAIGGWTRLPHPAILWFLAFAAWAAVTASWSLDPVEALRAAGTIAAIVLIGELLGALFARLEPVDAELVAGWFGIGAVFGILWLLVEVSSGYAIQRWIFNTWPGLRPSVNSMLVIQNGWIVGINPANGNWSVAGVNLMLWPLLLIMSVIGGSVSGPRIAAIVYALVLGVTIVSEHQTSMLAFLGASLIFLVARSSPSIAGRVSQAAFVVVVLGMVPLASYIYGVLKLHEAPWLHPSLVGRFQIWGFLSERIREAPLFGSGAISDSVIPREMGVHSHNFYIQIWHELGAVGVALTLVAGILTLRSISRMDRRAQPYAYALAATVVIETIATWNVWHSWVAGAIVIAVNLMRLATRIATRSPDDPALSFRETWLAPKARDIMQMHWRSVVTGVFIATVIAGPLLMFEWTGRYLRLEGKSFNLDWRPDPDQLVLLRGKTVKLSVAMRSENGGSLRATVLDDKSYTLSHPLDGSGWQAVTVTHRISPDAKVIALRFATYTGDRSQVADIADLAAEVDGQPFALGRSKLMSDAGTPGQRPKLPWSLHGDDVKLTVRSPPR